MSRLAEIKDLTVINIIKGDPLKFPQYTDVTGIECVIGWTDNEDGTFTDNTVPVVSENIITVDDFIDRIPRAAFETIANHASAEAKTLMAALNARANIDLDNDKTAYYVGRMLAAALITQAEHDAILA